MLVWRLVKVGNLSFVLATQFVRVNKLLTIQEPSFVIQKKRDFLIFVENFLFRRIISFRINYMSEKSVLHQIFRITVSRLKG